MGKIILLNTPIGNLGDLTPRVQEALKMGEVFAAEDTRVFKELLNHLGISVQGKRIYSLHDQSDPGQIQKLIELTRGGDLYVASEAGSPIVSDPAYPLVVAAYESGIQVDSYSGVSSPIMALELSGLPPLPFHFHGFLPREKGKIQSIFSDLSYGTHIFFEAPTRIESTLEELKSTLPHAAVALVRELSKKFQQVIRFRASGWDEVKEQVTVKGEFILVIHQSQNQGKSRPELLAVANEILENGGGPKPLAKLLGLILDRPTKEIYTLLSKK